MLETISLIVSVAAGLLSSVKVIDDMGGIKRTTASFFLEEIAATLDEVVLKFKHNEIPHGACEQMRHYALNIPTTMKGMVDADKLIEYSNELYYAHEIELLYKDVMNDKDKLVELEKAAGMFRAASVLVKL